MTRFNAGFSSKARECHLPILNEPCNSWLRDHANSDSVDFGWRFSRMAFFSDGVLGCNHPKT